jgi:hypothetical protein
VWAAGDAMRDVARYGLGDDIVYYNTRDVVGFSCESRVKVD